jgi:hypothetical protein
MPEQPFRPVGAATPVLEATAGAAAAAVMGAASAIRRRRVFHPDGVAFEASFQATGAHHGAALLDDAGRHDAIVRLSRGVGLPRSVPDFLGIAVRIPDAHGPDQHQDLLLVSAGDRPGLRHALVPARSFDHGRFSTLLPYDVGGRKIVFGARLLDADAAAPIQLGDLRRRAADGDVRFALELAEPKGGWEPIGVLRLGSPMPDEAGDALRFDPANTGGGIEPVGVVQAVRRLAYRASQAARPTT